MSTLRHTVARLLEPGVQASPREKLVDFGIAGVVLLSVLATVLETLPDLSGYGTLFRGIETFVVTVFVVEYLLRLWTCVEHRRSPHPLWGRLRYAGSPMGLIDLLAIVPFFLPLFGVQNLTVLRILRLFRMLQLLKLVRYSHSLQTLSRVFASKRDDLLIALSLVAVLLLISSTVVYGLEHEAQPKSFSSIPATMWWGVVTLTTVGYGDMFPVTPLGKLFGGITAFLGVGLIALPTGILASGFSEEMARQKLETPSSPTPNGAGAVVCPHCGRALTPQTPPVT